MIPLAIVSRNFKHYRNLFNQHSDLQNTYTLIHAGASPSHLALAKAQVILGNPNIAASYLPECKALKWFQSTWAGNNKLQSTANLNYTLTGVKDIFAAQMSEYVMAYLLYFARNIEAFNQLKKQATWANPQRSSLQGKTLGIMGLGNIGSSVAKVAQAFSMTVIGLAQTPKNLSDIQCFLPNDIQKFAHKCDYIVNLLPQTEQTKGLCDAAFFESMQSQSVFINAGRGNVIDKTTSLLGALEKGILKAAVLDVFEDEPLPANHPYYEHENIYITCHTAAVSQPVSIFAIFVKNAMKYKDQTDLDFVHNFDKGY